MLTLAVVKEGGATEGGASIVGKDMLGRRLAGSERGVGSCGGSGLRLNQPTRTARFDGDDDGEDRVDEDGVGNGPPSGRHQLVPRVTGQLKRKGKTCQ